VQRALKSTGYRATREEGAGTGGEAMERVFILSHVLFALEADLENLPT